MKSAKLSSRLKPFAVDDLVRLGRDHDGGYLVDMASVKRSDVLLAFGIAEDWSFEEAFIATNPVPIHAFDGSIDIKLHIKKLLKSVVTINKPQRFFQRLRTLMGFMSFFKDDRKYHKTMVGSATISAVSLADVLNDFVIGKYEHVFIKCDIEGSEYRLLDDIVRYSHLIEGMVIEFHDVDLNQQRIIDFLDRVPFRICHVHPNNSAGVAPNGIPFLVEVTFARLDDATAGTAMIPHPRDQANNPRQDDIAVIFVD